MPEPSAQARVRRDSDQLIAALEGKIEAIKARAARKRAKSNPAVRFTVAAIRSMDKAMSAATDAVLRKALEEARGGLTAYLALQGVVPAARAGTQTRVVRRSTEALEQTGASLLDYLREHPGQRSEDIATALGSDTKAIRRPMQSLLAERKIKTTGARRGMRYYAA
jgi:hypothetical protein